MATIATLLLLYIIIKWALIIGGIVIGFYIIAAIVRAVRVSQMKSKVAEAEAAHGKGSIGAIAAREEMNVPKAVEKKQEAGSNKPNSGNKEYKMASVSFTRDGKKYDYICDNTDISVGDYVAVDANGKEKTVRVLGINILKESELALPIERYKHVLRKADNAEPDIDDVSVNATVETDEGFDEYDPLLDDMIDEPHSEAEYEMRRYDIEDEYECPYCGSSDTDGNHCYNCGEDF